MQFSRFPKSHEKRWYLGVLCAKCRSPILFGRDRTEGRGPFNPPAKLFLTCSEDDCGHRADTARFRWGAMMFAGYRDFDIAPRHEKVSDDFFA